MTLTHGELFSGVGGFSQGFESTHAIETRWACEIDPAARNVFAKHYEAVDLYTDVNYLRGSPCQDLSVAGARKGFGGARSVLYFEACRIIEEMRNATELRFPRWAVWENVAGALSSKGGRDFGQALDELANLGAVVIEWHVLNAVHFGVPQRRRRVFVIACFDPGAERLGEVLPVATRVRGNPATSVEARPGAAPSTRGGLIANRGVVQGLTGGLGSGGPDAQHAQAGWLVPDTVTFVKTHRANSDTDAEIWKPADVAPTLNTSDNQSDVRATALIKPIHGETENFHAQESGLEDLRPMRDTTRAQEVLGEAGGQGSFPEATLLRPGVPKRVLDGASHQRPALGVRRLTPREAERLMGWPDDWTRYGADGKEIADSTRYRLCGNGVVAPVAAWIGKHLVRCTNLLDG
jgi:DNA (cytosine-5)-methyltransferase 1